MLRNTLACTARIGLQHFSNPVLVICSRALEPTVSTVALRS